METAGVGGGEYSGVSRGTHWMWGWEDLSERAVIELRIYSGHLLDLSLGHQKRSPSSQAFDVFGGYLFPPDRAYQAPSTLP